MKLLRYGLYMNSFAKCLLACFLAGLWLLILLPPSVYASTYIVNTALDENDHSCSDGDCSLRDAIELAAAGDTINFSEALTIYLGSQLAIARNLTIDGGPYTITISGDTGNDGSRNVRAFNISAGSAVSLAHLNIIECYHADRGSAIYNAGTLTVNQCSFSHNAADYGGGAINNHQGSMNISNSTFSYNSGAYGAAILLFEGALTIQNSTFFSNVATNAGGALYYYRSPDNLTPDSITVLTSTFSENTAWYGGAMDIRNILLIVRNSVFARNAAGIDGGGIYYEVDNYTVFPHYFSVADSTFTENVAGINTGANSKGGGGIYNKNGVMTIQNSTFSGNQSQKARGGAITSWYSATILNSTLVGNSGLDSPTGGGFLSYSGTFNMQNTIIANNSPGGDCLLLSTVVVTNSNNLVGDGSCSENSVNFLSGDPEVGPLADNGGGLLTHALLPGSPALDSGAGCLATDQRGVTRPQGGACDRGALEMPAQPILQLTHSVTPTADVSFHGLVTYTLTLTNRGALIDNAVRLTDTLPAEVTFGSWVLSPTQTVQVGNSFTWTGILTPGRVLTWTFSGVHNGSLPGQIVTNVAAISGTIQHSFIPAAFQIQPGYLLTMRFGGNGGGRVGIEPPGLTCETTCLSGYLSGTVVTLTATPLLSSTFSGWSGDREGTTSPITVGLNAARNLTATFTLKSYGITPTAGTYGTILPNTPQTVNYGDTITFTVTPTTGYHIVDVTVDGISQGTIGRYTFNNVTASHTIRADFAINTYTLNITQVGQGQVTRVPSQTTYTHGTAVTLTAIPTAGWYFDSWSGDLNSVLTQTSWTMNGNKAVTATFKNIPSTYHTLTVGLSGNGTVTPGVGTHSYVSGTTVDLSTGPALGWHFTGWTGAVTGSLPTAQVTLNAGKAVTANFAVNTYTLTPTAGTNGSFNPAIPQIVNYGDSRTFTISPNAGYHIADVGVDGLSQGAIAVYTFTNVTADHIITATFAINSYTLNTAVVGQGQISRVPSQTTYLHGSVVTLTATPTTGWYFGQWSGGASGISTQTTVVMDSHKTITATFFSTPPVYYTLTVSLSGNGTVTPGVGTHSYLSGTIVDLSAGPANGWTFIGWTGAVTGSTPTVQITMDGHKTITAMFRARLFLPIIIRQG